MEILDFFFLPLLQAKIHSKTNNNNNKTSRTKGSSKWAGETKLKFNDISATRQKKTGIRQALSIQGNQKKIKGCKWSL